MAFPDTSQDSDTLIMHPSSDRSRSDEHGGWAGIPPPTPRPPLELPATDGNLKPWLGLRARLALSPISVALVSLLFVATRLVISAGDVDDKVDGLKRNILATCRGAEGAASTLASLPTVMAHNANQATIKAIESTVRGTGRVLMLAITAVEEVLKWLVDSYRSLFVCFIELLVRGSLAVLLSAVQLISDAVHEAAQGIRAAIQASVEGVNALLSGTISGINAIIGVFGQHVNPPSIDVPSLDALSNISLPTEIQDSLLRINSSLPSLDELRQKMDAFISGPFEQMKADVNQTITDFRFDHAALPEPPLNNVTFCHDVDTSALDDLAHDIKKLVYIGIGLVALLMVGLALLCAGSEWWSWRSMRKHVEYTKEAWEDSDRAGDSFAAPWRTDEKVAPSQALRPATATASSSATTSTTLSTERIFNLLELSKHPLLALVAFKVARFFGLKDPASRARLRWWLSWISHPAAVAALVAGLVGLLSVELQIIAARSVQGVYEGKLGNAFDGIGDDIARSVNAKMLTASTDFANKSNTAIGGAEDALNDHLFRWVNTTTTTMNDTLNEFMDDITGALNDVLGSTPLNAPLQTFIQCILGRKVAGIQTALTWMHDNAHVNFTRVDDDVLLIGGDALRRLSDPIKASMMGQDGGGDDDGVVGRLVGAYVRHLEKERVMFYIFLAIYALVLVAGTAIVFWDQIRDRASAWQRSRKPWLKAPVTPFRALSLRRTRTADSEADRAPMASGAPRCGPSGPRLNFSAISYPVLERSTRDGGTMDAPLTAQHPHDLPNLPNETASLNEKSGKLDVPTAERQRSSAASTEDPGWSWLSYLRRAARLSMTDAGSCGPPSDDIATSGEASPTMTMRSAYSQATGVTGHGSRASISTAHRRRTSRLLDEAEGGSPVSSHATGIDSAPSPLRQRFSPSPSQHTFGHRTSSVAPSASTHATHAHRQSRISEASQDIDAADTIVVSRQSDLEAGSRAPLDCQAALVASDLERRDSIASRRRQLRFTATPTQQVEAPDNSACHDYSGTSRPRIVVIVVVVHLVVFAASGPNVISGPSATAQAQDPKEFHFAAQPSPPPSAR
ncbi:uncharacterized protein PFL1_05481 [Pseudozyma flocculosa PF-1]|uniref:Plasma membrane fusion protein PRM1 n=2 Tax=Pseudozyma flocculosa TaxID=84751 RepID=A0A5C3FEF7_9BASI|nr:uncharacterized protein PFL1_05481 [Pseudozyma flocculosa PF-1]EPQ26846.1 hypothetical protein PFL1_05481 [Pseudozyma flocculosa PF-1]SPO42085.1 uncharacterized protein PSFLO_07568 [Pseudozyma flocculosa]